MLWEQCLNDARDGPWQGHAWDLMVMSHCAGGLRSGKQYTELLEQNGFSDVQIVKTQAACNIDVIIAKKKE